MAFILHYDCFAGISGDMNLGALIDLGVDPNYLNGELKKLPVKGYKILVKPDMRRGVSGTKVTVEIEQQQPSSILQMNIHSHEHRSYKEIKQIINNSSLNEFVKQKSIAIFQKLAEAEGKIHNKDVDEVHFHEVGAVDSIVDIVGAAICIDFLKPSKITCSAIELGSGMVKCEHGLFPVPAPATAEVLKGIPVKTGTVPFEATTPTGAAILSVIVDEFTQKNNFQIEKTAYGIGHKDSPVPNVLRIHRCTSEEIADIKTDQIMLLECNIDDMNPEVYESLFELLFTEGADDVYLHPIIMKKSRPAVILSIICHPSKAKHLSKIILQHTSTLGVRFSEKQRFILDREIIEIETSLGKVRVKKAWQGTDILKMKPEYEDCARIAKEMNIPVYQVMSLINREINLKS